MADALQMVMETIDKIITNLGVSDVDQRLEEQLVDGMLYAFQEQTGEDTQVMLSGTFTRDWLNFNIHIFNRYLCGNKYMP